MPEAFEVEPSSPSAATLPDGDGLVVVDPAATAAAANNSDEIVIYRRRFGRKSVLCFSIGVLVVAVFGMIGLFRTNSSEKGVPSSTVPQTPQWRQLGEALSNTTWEDVNLALSNSGDVVVVGNRNLEMAFIYECDTCLDADRYYQRS